MRIWPSGRSVPLLNTPRISPLSVMMKLVSVPGGKPSCRVMLIVLTLSPKLFDTARPLTWLKSSVELERRLRAGDQSRRRRSWPSAPLMIRPLPSNVIVPLPRTVSTPVNGSLSSDVAYQR